MIGILNAYHFDPTPGSYQEEYSQLMLSFVAKVFPDRPIRNFDVALGNWPQNIDECEVWFITGSAKASYDSDTWIQQLKEFIVKLHQEKRKLVGICFGHQLISVALGGDVIKSPKGWGVGVRNFQILQSQPWMNPPMKQVSLLFSHQDQVVQLPQEANLLAQDSFCEFQMYQIGQHILTLQGHPEFSVEFAKARLVSRKNLVPPETYQTAMESFESQKDDQVLAQWIRNFCLI